MLKYADKVECGVVMDGDDGVCAYVAPGSDPTDALTIAWKDDDDQQRSECQVRVTATPACRL